MVMVERMRCSSVSAFTAPVKQAATNFLEMYGMDQRGLSLAVMKGRQLVSGRTWQSVGTGIRSFPTSMAYLLAARYLAGREFRPGRKAVAADCSSAAPTTTTWSEGSHKYMATKILIHERILQSQLHLLPRQFSAETDPISATSSAHRFKLLTCLIITRDRRIAHAFVERSIHMDFFLNVPTALCQHSLLILRRQTF